MKNCLAAVAVAAGREASLLFEAVVEQDRDNVDGMGLCRDFGMDMEANQASAF